MEGGDKLSNFAVGSVPTLYYIPDFVTDSEQDELLNNIYRAPVSKWKSLKNRRLQNWGGIVHEKGLLAQDLPPWLGRTTERIFEESGLFPSAINHVLINEYLPNQGIMAHQDGPAYTPVVAILSLGSAAIMDFTPHSNLQQQPNNAMIQNGEEVLNLHQPFSVLLMPRSLLIFKDNAYSDYLHGIKDSEVQQFDGVVNFSKALLDVIGTNNELSVPGKTFEVKRVGDANMVQRVNTRVSLTCRVVPKVHKNLFKF